MNMGSQDSKSLDIRKLDFYESRAIKSNKSEVI